MTKTISVTATHIRAGRRLTRLCPVAIALEEQLNVKLLAITEYLDDRGRFRPAAFIAGWDKPLFLPHSVKRWVMDFDIGISPHYGPFKFTVKL